MAGATGPVNHPRRPQVVSSGDMSRNGMAGPVPAGGWLDEDQQRAWLAYIRVHG